MEQISEPPEGAWQKAEASASNPRARLPGFSFLVWMIAIAAVACLQGVRTAADHARASGLPRLGLALDALAVLGAVVLTAAALVNVSRRWSST